MIAEINGVVSSVRALSDLVRANKTLTNFNELVAAVAEVNAKLLTAQSVAMASHEKQLALTNRIAALEKTIMQFENWEREKERYPLTQMSPGVYTNALKPGMQQNEPPHCLCAQCFLNRKKSLLQLEMRNYMVSGRCQECASRIYIEPEDYQTYIAKFT